MPRGTWSFLHEWVIYEYLMARFQEKTLRLRPKIRSGKLQLRERWKKVEYLEPIIGTAFPDIESMRLSGFSSECPAEVKFTTSLFNYHRRTLSKFKAFMKNGGIIVVLSHDYLPKGLDCYDTDVYEIDQTDFIAFCRENFVRLLNRQISMHTETKVWVMYQGPNFNNGTGKIRLARESGIWCPTDNLTGFDLAIGDRILFVKTSGASTQEVQKSYLKGTIADRWSLDEIYVGELSSLYTVERSTA